MLLFFCCIICTSAKISEKDKPNLVLIISDDQAWNDYGFMGHEIIQTPHLDRLSKEGVLFRRGYVPTALCRPSLMTLASGHYAHFHGITGNDPSPKYAKGSGDVEAKKAKLISYSDRFSTLPKLLGKQGYLSHQSGKWWEGSFRRGGFSHGMTRGFPEIGGRHGDDGLKIGREGMQPIADFVKMSVDLGKPFFIWFAPFLPHTPHNPPARLFEKYRRKVASEHIARYYAMCEWFDECCGKLRKIIDQNGVAENTFIVYVTDNGWIQSPRKKGYAPRSKQTAYEGGIRTPMIFHWQKRFASSDRRDLVSSIDIFPTLIAAANAKMPSPRPGLNLMPNLLSGFEIGRSHIRGEGFSHDIADLEKPESSLLYRWVIEGRWKLMLSYDGEVHRYQSTHSRSEGPQLFDLFEDPWEKINRAKMHPIIVKRLASYLDKWYRVKDPKTL